MKFTKEQGASIKAIAAAQAASTVKPGKPKPKPKPKRVPKPKADDEGEMATCPKCGKHGPLDEFED